MEVQTHSIVRSGVSEGFPQRNKGWGLCLHRPGTLLLASMNQDTDGNNRPGEFIGPLSQSALGEKQVEDQWEASRGVVPNGLAGGD